MKKDRGASVTDVAGASKKKRQTRREFLIKTGAGALAFGAVPLRGWAADPDQYRRALSDHRQHGPDRRWLRRRRKARRRHGQRGRRHQIARRRQAQSDHFGRAERHHGDPHRNRPPDHRQQTLRDPRMLRQRAHPDRERSGRTRQGAADHRLELGPAQQGTHLYVHAVRARLAIREGAIADVEARQRQAKGRRDLRKHRVRHLDIERTEGTGARRRRRDRDVRALFGRIHRCEPADQQGQGIRRQHAVLGLVPERPHPDRAHRQAGRPQRSRSTAAPAASSCPISTRTSASRPKACKAWRTGTTT